MQNLNLTVKVVEKLPTMTVNEKEHCSAIVEDETGRIKLNLWREQVHQVKVGDMVRVPNAFVHGRKNSLQISTWSDIKPVSHS